MTKINHAAHLVQSADMILFVTGAGMGVDSGLPDFRGNEGFWRAYPALERSGLDFISIASPHAFRQRPEIAWGFYGHRLKLYRQTKPHVGYDILKKWGENSPYGYMAFTSNVDGHFQKANFDVDLITECHGSINYLQCLDSCSQEIWSAEGFTPVIDEANCLLINEAPRCPHCGGLARPNIYMFGDGEWVQDRTFSQRQKLTHTLERCFREDGRLLVIEIGAGSAVSTARDFTHRMVSNFQASVIRINPLNPEIHESPNHVSLAMGGLQALQQINAVLTA